MTPTHRMEDTIMTTDDILGMTLPELDAAVEARIRADRVSVDAPLLDALDAAITDEGDFDTAAAARALSPRRDRAQLERVIAQFSREQERRTAHIEWLERYAHALAERAAAGPADLPPARDFARPFADELARLVGSWPAGPRLRVA